MTPTHVIVEGTLNADGSLDLDRKLALPPGRVQLIVQPLPELPNDDPFWQHMQGIWAGQEARGQAARTKEEIDAEISAMRKEANEEMQESELLHEQCRMAREGIRQQGGEPT